MYLHEAIQNVQNLGKEYGFSVVVVGGSIVRFIGKKTTIKHIYLEKKEIILENTQNPTLVRSEDAKTTIDIDCIAFSLIEDPFTKTVKQKFYALKKALKHLSKQSGFPAISLEPVLYHPYFPKPNQVTQFVSSIESYHDQDYFFRLGSVKQDVKRESLALWTYVLDHSYTIVSFNPHAIQMRYNVRGFTIKPKDQEKIWGKHSAFAMFVQEFNKKTKGKYEKDLLEWNEFAMRVQESRNVLMKTKKALWNAYWQTIGTYLAHGSGFVGKLLLPLGNTLFAGK